MLNQMFKTLAARTESYSNWASKVNIILNADQDNKSGKCPIYKWSQVDSASFLCDWKYPVLFLSFVIPPDLEELRALVVEAEKMMYPEMDLLLYLRQTVQDAEKSALMAQQLLNGKRQTR